MDPVSSVARQLLPVLLAYCTDQPVTSTATSPALCSSTKSLVRVAPEFPPPPYTSLITTSLDRAEAAVTGRATVAAISAEATPARRVREGCDTAVVPPWSMGRRREVFPRLRPGLVRPRLRTD